MIAVAPKINTLRQTLSLLRRCLRHNLREPRHQVLLWPVALEPVAVTAQELEVVDVVGAAPRPWDDVVHLKVPELEV